jgi:hypothetical protein
MADLYRNDAVSFSAQVQSDNPGLASSGRRAWILRSAAGLGILFSGSRLLAQPSSLGAALESMSALTGTHMPHQWLEPVTGLVDAILEDSKPLRSLDLGSIEPATIFRPD